MQPNQNTNGDEKQPDAGNTRQRGVAKRILIAYDGSAGADAALTDLVRAGLPDELEVLVLSVAEQARPEVVGRFAREMRPTQQAVSRAVESLSHRLAEQACSRLRSLFPRWKVEPATMVASPAWGIVRRVAEWKVDLVVTGAHGQSCSERMLLGSVARRVFADAACSIRIARRCQRPAESSLRIVVAVDGSSADDAVIESVSGRAWTATTEFQVVTVVDARLDAVRVSTKSFAAAWKRQHGVEADARACRLMEKCRNRLRAAGLLCVDTLIFEGDLVSRLAQQAKAWEADCLFLGIHCRGRCGGRILERTVFAAAACAPCSVEFVSGRNPPREDARGSEGEPDRDAPSAQAEPAGRTARRESRPRRRKRP